MVMRPAFSVAVSVDPDILIIDEVLGVGDVAFFAKCQERILQFRRAGKTILCVSHSIPTLKDLCTRAIWLDHGRMLEGRPAGAGIGGLSERHEPARRICDGVKQTAGCSG